MTFTIKVADECIALRSPDALDVVREAFVGLFGTQCQPSLVITVESGNK